MSSILAQNLLFRKVDIPVEIVDCFESAECGRCYVCHIVQVFREVWRVCRPDATVWCNLGDCYASQGGNHAGRDDQKGVGAKRVLAAGAGDAGARTAPNGLKPKDLVGIPWRVAFALQADGWYLRSDIIWAKPNPMPESVTDRPTKSHEYLFLLSKRSRYFYDAEAIKEPANYGGYKDARAFDGKNAADVPDPKWDDKGRTTRNRRDVWTIPTAPYKSAHFATFPPALVEPCILAATSAKGNCPVCGKPWERVVDHTKAVLELSETAKKKRAMGPATQTGGKQVSPASSITTGWRPTCFCGTEHPIPESDLDADPTLMDDFEIESPSPVPAIVLDPFCGSGTVGQVCMKHGRRFVGMDLSRPYLKLAEERLLKAPVGLL